MTTSLRTNPLKHLAFLISAIFAISFLCAQVAQATEPAYGLIVSMKAKPGKEKELEEFLRGALPMAKNEEGTDDWFAIQGEGAASKQFFIVDTFENEAGREAHLQGPIAAALMGKADQLLTEKPKIEKVKILAAK